MVNFVSVSFEHCFCRFSDLLELHLPRTCETDFPDQNDLLNFKLNVQPDEVRRLYMFINISFNMSKFVNDLIYKNF